MFENRKVYIKALDEEIYISRIIASWKNGGGMIYGNVFKKWLESLGINENDVYDIFRFATNGKLELESSAEKYIIGNKN